MNLSSSHQSQRPWTPVLQGDLRRRITDLIVPIADATTQVIRTKPNPTLASGTAGQALVLGYLGRCGFHAPYADNARKLMGLATDSLPMLAAVPALYGGYSGIAWASAQLRRNLGDASDPDDFTEIDLAIRQRVAGHPWQDDYDLISGLVGFGVYLLNRLPDPVAMDGLVEILRRLDETATTTTTGTTWLTSPKLMIPETAARYPVGNFNLGLAHGVPGVIAFLARAFRAGVAPEMSRRLLETTMQWLLANRLPADSRSSFRYNILPSDVPGQALDQHPARLAWCYGDLGVILAIIAATQAIPRADWQQAATETLEISTRRTREVSGVVDAGICHGAAGNALIYARIYHATNDQRALVAARMWYEVCLDMYKPDTGVGGYRSWSMGKDEQVCWENDPGLLTGSGGVCAIFAAGVSDIEPDWDGFLLSDVSVGPQQQNRS